MADKILRKTGDGLVEVELEERRLMEEGGNVWVGPGVVKVPAYIAEGWGLEVDEFENPPPSPVVDYDDWNIEEITTWAASAGDSEREAAIVYETANQNRKGVLTALGATPKEK